MTDNLQFQLRREQRQSSQPQFDDATDDTEDAATETSDAEALPKWITDLAKTEPEAYAVTAPFDELLEQLPQMRDADEITKRTYFDQLIQELVKVYYYRLRIVQLSDELTDKQKPLEQTKLLDECKETIAQLADWLETSDGSTTI